jgi:Rad3-related DNA helicase
VSTLPTTPASTLPTPADLGLPPKFSTWRAGQYSAIDQACQALSSGSHLVVINAPTGSGKSGMAVAAANVLGGRTIVCTSTKPLQKQYMDDFAGVGMVDVRGRGNYLCSLGNGTTCEDGYDEGCPDAPFAQCGYRGAYLIACGSQLVATNYSYWSAIHRYGEGLGGVAGTNLLVCDEAHTAFQEICSAMALEFSEQDVAFLLGARLPNHDLGLVGWKDWARQLRPAAAAAVYGAEQAAQDRPGQARTILRRLRRLRRILASLVDLEGARGEWVFHRRRTAQSEVWCCDPVWASPYADPILFSHARQALLVSATVTRRTMHLLGFDPEDYTYIEVPTQFPPASSPVYWIPTASMRQNMSVAEKRALYDRVDEIITVMGPRKGIIHTVSYDRAEEVYKASRYSGIMILHERGGAGIEGGVNEFRASPGPAVLVSPAITQGFDFAGEDSEYQILIKLPFPDSTNPVTRARTGADIVRPRGEDDKAAKQLGSDYLDYVVSQVLIQACGRSMRSAQDRCMSFILDDNWRWWRWRAEKGGCFPFWFRRLLKQSRNVPPPLPRVAGGSLR